MPSFRVLVLAIVVVAAVANLLVSTTTAFTPTLVAKVSLLQQQQQNYQLSTLLAIKKTSTTTKLYAATIPTKDESSNVGTSDIANNDTTNFDIENQLQLLLGVPIPYNKLTIGVLKEIYPGENRVAQTPDSIRTLIKAGMNVVVQSGGTFLYYNKK
jgi:Alanine dehydrogenase/PNT, N-terminal domain